MCGEGRAVSSWGRGRGGKGREQGGRPSGTLRRGPRRCFLPRPQGSQRGRRPVESGTSAWRGESMTRPVGTATWAGAAGGEARRSADVTDGLQGAGGRGAASDRGRFGG